MSVPSFVRLSLYLSVSPSVGLVDPSCVSFPAAQDVDGSLMDMDAPGDGIPSAESSNPASEQQAAALAVAGKSKSK